MENHYECLPPPRPDKNYVLFTTDWVVTYDARQVCEGEVGDLPLLLGVTCGYDPDDADSYMRIYETDEVFFAYRWATQTRVLLQDSQRRTLSLPASSTLTFRVGTEGGEGCPLSHVLAHHCLPVTVRFANPQDLVVTRQLSSSHSLSEDLQLIRVYDEPYLLCLSIDGSGHVRDTPRVIPRNLKDVSFAQITSVKGAVNTAAKVSQFMKKFTQSAQRLRCHHDPFFQDLAVVSHGPRPLQNVVPYMEQNTFIPTRHSHPHQQTDVPSLPPRNPAHPSCQQPDRDRVDRRATVSPEAESLSASEEHVYCEPLEAGVRKAAISPQTPPVTSCRTSARAHTPPPAPPLLPATPRPLLPPLSLPAAQCYASSGSGSDDSDFQSCATLPAMRVRKASRWELDSLTIEDVGFILSELGLSRLASRFRKKCIDGMVLQKLTPDILHKDLKMKPVEVVLLHTFITKGHIPKCSKSNLRRELPSRFLHQNTD